MGRWKYQWLLALWFVLLWGCHLELGNVPAERVSSDIFRNPSGVTATDNYIYVTDVNYISYSEGYGDGFVVVIDKDDYSIVGTIATAHKNPQFITRVDSADDEILVISNTGELFFDGDNVHARSEGGIEIWRETDDPLRPEQETYELGQEENNDAGGIGHIMVSGDGRYLYGISGFSPVLFKFDLIDKQWVYDAERPYQLYDADGYNTHSGAADSKGFLYLTSFNYDALYIFDTQCDALVAGPIDLGTAPNILEGPHSVVVYEIDNTSIVYFNTSISNVLGAVWVDYSSQSLASRCSDDSAAIIPPDITIEPSMHVVGPTSNALAIGDESVWVVESGSNTVSKLNLANDEWSSGFVDIGNERNPYGIYFDHATNRIYITNFVSQSVSVVKAADGTIIEEIL